MALVEQPVPAWNLAAMARLRARPGTPAPCWPTSAIFDSHDMLAVAAAGAADAVSLKIVKHAGLLGVRKVAAGGAGGAASGLYGGCLLESSVGCRGASAGVRHATDPGVGLRAFRPADPDGRLGHGAACASRTSTSTCRPVPAIGCNPRRGGPTPLRPELKACCITSKWTSIRRRAWTRPPSTRSRRPRRTTPQRLQRRGQMGPSVEDRRAVLRTSRSSTWRTTRSCRPSCRACRCFPS